MTDTTGDNRSGTERAVLVGVRSPDEPASETAEHLDELADLAAGLQITVADRAVVLLRAPQPEYYIGSGKASEIVSLCQSGGAEILIFDVQLSPSQQRNWEKLSSLRVMDREEVILDIFARRASTREAVLQVELARLHYHLPRLTRAWTHLSRQHGGITGARGQGEAQIENDRRLVKRRIASLEMELADVRRQRAVGRKRRERRAVPHAAIVGYTNAGKSSLLRALSGSDVLVADRLFATLDPTTRRITLPDHQQLLLTDTVGFVRKLPHSLVEAFKATLEEAVLADFLILVLDLSSPQLEAQWETTLSVLHELGADDKNIIVVFNKMDAVDRAENALLVRARTLFPGGIWISARTGEGLDLLRERLSAFAGMNRRFLHVTLPPSRHDLAALAHAHGHVLEERYEEDGRLELTFYISRQLQHKFDDYQAHKRPTVSQP